MAWPGWDWLIRDPDLTDLDEEFAAYYDDTPIYHATARDVRPQPSPFWAKWRDENRTPSLPSRRENGWGVLALVAAALVVVVVAVLFIGGGS